MRNRNETNSRHFESTWVLTAMPSKFNVHSDFVVKKCREELLPHQYNACERVRTWFCKEGTQEKAMVCMPTGTGKTGVMCCLPFFLGSELNDGAEKVVFNGPILVIAPNLDIASQLRKAMLPSPENFLVKRAIVPDNKSMKRDVLPTGIKVEQRSELAQEDLECCDLVIANAQKFLEGPWQNELLDNLFEVVMVDEAHHFPAETWSRIIEKFERHAKVVFLTATPYRSDGKAVVEGEFAFRLSLKEARDKGIIRRTTLTATDDPNPIVSILREIKRVQEEKNQLQPLPNNTPHMAIAIARGIQAADEAVVLWNNMDDTRGTAIAYHGKLGPRELQENMTKIKSNKVKLVVVVNKLQEGFDHPPISIAAILKRIGSANTFAQFIGRAQRIVRSEGVKESPNIVANIVTHIDFQQSRNYELFENECLIPVNNDG